MNISNTHMAVMTGMSPYTPDAFSEAVAARFLKIKETAAFSPQEGNFCYDGNRCLPENIGWRTCQKVGFEVSPADVKAGKYDKAIVLGFHAAASSEYYYRFEKDWG